MSSPGTTCTARGELRAIVFRRRPMRGRNVGGRSNGSRFRRSARPASCIGQCRGCARSVSCTLSRRAPYPRVALCSQTFVHSRHAPHETRDPAPAFLASGAFFGRPFRERSKRPQCGIAGEHQRGLFAQEKPRRSGAFCLPIANRRLARMTRRLNVPIDTSESPGRLYPRPGFSLAGRSAN